MDPAYTEGGYGYQNRAQSFLNAGSDESNTSETGDVNAGGEDILQNFPYLRHGGFRQDDAPHVPHTHHQAQTTLPTLHNYQPAFMQHSNMIMPMTIPNSLGFQDNTTAQQGKLPSMATFNTALSQMQNERQGVIFEGLVTTTPQSMHHQAPVFPSLHEQQSLPPVSMIAQSTFVNNLDTSCQHVPDNIASSMQSTFPVGNMALPLSGNVIQQTSLAATSAYYPQVTQQANVTPSMCRDAGSYAQNNYRNTTKDNQSEKNISSRGNVKRTNSNSKQSKPVKQTSVPFTLLGTLAHQKQKSFKSFKEIMLESIDTEDIMHDYSMHMISRVNIKTEIEDELQGQWQNVNTPGSENVVTQMNRYTEPSIADIRAGALRGSTLSRVPKDEVNETPDKEGNEVYESVTNTTFGNTSLQESWYNSALKNVDDPDGGCNTMEPAAKKGGRSDPDNPFAITSPSFSESAAKAVMTTTNSSVATFVTISIMSIGSRKKLIPNILSSSAAEGGIVSVVNPVIESAAGEEEEEEGDTELKHEKTSIMSKLKREKKEKKEQEDEENDTEIDRLDISIKIDDDQLICHGEHKRWQCRLCQKSYTTKHNLVAHIMDHSGIKPHLCLVCGKYFKQLSHLNTHMLTHDNVKPHKCPICHKGFTQISHLRRHETMHLGSKPYICDICNRGFAYPSELRIHKEKHVPGKEKCTECELEFSSQKELHGHMLSDNHCKSLTCRHCEKVFKFPSQLKVHMMCHAGARPFICTECGMDFMKEHHLKAHQFTHTGLRPYTCPHCNRAFNQKANMVRHMLIHNAERAFKCHVCNKTFTQPQTLKAHMVVHSDKKPYSCRYCGKQFGRQHNLQGHLHIHSDTKPYVCSICQSSFTLKGNLNRHKKVKHGLNESTESMEEDAVNFLNSLSHRVGDTGLTEYDDDGTRDEESNDGQLSLDNRSPKKGRKSTPRKRVTSRLYGDGEGGGSDVESDEDTEESQNMITYSDEERENERVQGLKSKYFHEPSVSDGTRPRYKRKLDLSYKQGAEDSDEENYNENDPNILLTEVKTELKDENENGVVANTAEHADNLMLLGNTVTEKRSMRKRKKKELDEGFTDEAFDDEEEEQQPSRSRTKKGAKLDTIIAAKFKNDLS